MFSFIIKVTGDGISVYQNTLMLFEDSSFISTYLMQLEDISSSEMLTQIAEPGLNKCLQGKKYLESKLVLRGGMKQIGDRFQSTDWVVLLAVSVISESGVPRDG